MSPSSNRQSLPPRATRQRFERSFTMPRPPESSERIFLSPCFACSEAAGFLQAAAGHGRARRTAAPPFHERLQRGARTAEREGGGPASLGGRTAAGKKEHHESATAVGSASAPHTARSRSRHDQRGFT